MSVAEVLCVKRGGKKEHEKGKEGREGGREEVKGGKIEWVREGGKKRVSERAGGRELELACVIQHSLFILE